ncbi:accessory Sec-dependent serine-rich glycoprotein adhesin, partial [Streptococcus mitis]|uniref:accessory Sec-dependent serine-rich glycoprotein adhesin n=1 Tax=Streptococcus mitis TaxID=28037 RepID=UPI001C5AF5B5
MFFRRQKGEYRETDRVTRYKLIKSGKHWLRASTSLFGLFKVLRGGVDTTQVMTEVVEDKVNPSITGLDIIKGLAATGAVLGGTVATQTKVFANETVAVEKTLENPDLLVTNDTVVLGTTSVNNSENSASLSTSLSESTSMSESVSKSSSASASKSTSLSASESTSNSASTSASVSTSTSISQSTSEPGSFSTVSSLSVEQSTSATATEQDSSVSKESTGLKIDSALLKATEIDGKVSASAAQSTSTTTSIVGVTAGAIATAEVSAKQQDDNRKKLTKLSAEMGEYLAKAVGLPNTDSAITKVNAAVTEIEKALADPTSDLTAVVQKATLARNSIVNAVLRANSGARDARNGKAMLRDASLRASWAPNQNDGRITVSSPDATFDKATGIATYTMNVQANSALSNVGVKINVGQGGHVQSATFNGNSMEKTFTQGSEIVYNYRHGQNRNLNGRIEVKVKYDNNVPTATADMQVQVSSAPIDQNTQGNASGVQSASVPTGYRQQNTNNQTTSKLGPQYNIDNRYKEVYNGDSINDLIGIQRRSDSNIYIYGIEQSDPVPGVNYVGNQMGVPGINRPNVFSYLLGTVGGNDLSAQIGKEYTYNFSSGQYNGQIARDSVKFLIKGFNERHDIQSGDIVRVSDLSHLTPEEIKEVYNNFINNDANKRDLLSNQDVVKNGTQPNLSYAENGKVTLSYPGTKSKIEVDTDGTITVTYRDGTSSTINATLEKEKEIPDVNVSVTRNGKEIQPVIGKDGNKYYYIYAGDDFKVDMTATDNKGKLREFKLVPESDGNRPASDLANNFFKDPKYGTGTVTSLSDPNGEIVATTSSPARITATGHMKDDLKFEDGNYWRRNAIATDKAGNYNQAGDANKGNFFIKQGKLSDIMDGVGPSETFQVENISQLNSQEKARILAAVEKLNNKTEKRIDSFSVSDNGTVTITYKDRTTDTVTIKVSDSDYKSRSASTSLSKSSSISASTSASKSASTSASKSTSVSASKSASTSASQSASTSASKSASTSASKSASTSASKSASTSA